MPVYKITRVMRYTETVEVEADTIADAIQISHEMEGDYNNDDYLHDVMVKQIRD